MPYNDILFRPGVNVQYSATLNNGNWSACNRIRFKDGLPEKKGGWLRLISQATVGIPRGLWAWADLAGFPYLAVGTAGRLAVYTPGQLNDITPIRATVNQAPDFATTINSPSVAVGVAGHAASVGDWVSIDTAIAIGGLILQGFYLVATVVDANHFTITAGSNATATVASPGGAVALFSVTNTLTTVNVTLANHGLAPTNQYTVHVSTTVGGIVINGTYLVQTVIDANHFTITAATAAGSTTTGSENGGQVRIDFLIASGLETAVYVTGYGSGGYGTGAYGVSTVVAGLAAIRQWSLDNWGQDLIASPTLGAIYYWVPSSSFPPALVISQAPAKNYDVLVANPAQILISFGCEVGGVFDPNLIRWCDASDFTDWIAASTNQAGSFRIPTGSKLVGGLALPLEILAWTDVDLYSMQYQGLPFVFGFRKVGSGCGLISKRAKANAADRVLWMGPKGFFQKPSGGAVTPLPCSVWDVVFKNMNAVQTDKINCAVNSMFNEVTWFYCSAASNEVDSYVNYNYVDQVWDYGMLDGAAWVDVNVFGAPIRGDTAGLLQQHEVAKDADGVAMVSWIQSSDVDIAKGEEWLFVDEFVTDGGKVDAGSTLQITITAKGYPADPSPMVNGPFAITSTSGLVNPNVRGRQVNILLQSSDLGSFWRLGRTRYRFAPDGRVG